MSREQWLRTIQAQQQEVGDCIEWQGRYMGKTPLVYVPRNFAWDGNTQSGQSVRAVLYVLRNGTRLPADTVIRMRCWNDKCVHEDHFGFVLRSKQAREQSRRGELQTAKRKTAARLRARGRGKVTPEAAEQIRVSGLSSKVEAAAHGVSTATITSIRRGEMHAAVLPGASVFTWARAQR